MKALTLWRPWSDAIVHGTKRVENRPWPPWPDVCGTRIALHAGLKYDACAWKMVGGYEPPAKKDSPTGIVGTALLVGALDKRGATPKIHGDSSRVKPFPWARLRTLHQDVWWCGPCGWLLDDVVAFDAIPCKGALGLWALPIATEAEVIKRERAARG